MEKVHQRLLRACAALESAGIPYAVVGGNAVALWVSRVDEGAVRNTRNVDILLRRSDLEAAKRALAPSGFIYEYVAGVDLFLDGPNFMPSQGVHIVFANETVKPFETIANPDVTDSESAGAYRVLALQALVQIKLTAFRRKDQVHLQDLISIGLIDKTWPEKFPPKLVARLQSLLNDPNG